MYNNHRVIEEAEGVGGRGRRRGWNKYKEEVYTLYTLVCIEEERGVGKSKPR